MLAPLLFGSGSSGTNNSSSSSSSNAGSTSSSGSSTAGSTSSPSPSETPGSSYQEPDTTEPGDVDDGTYQPTPAEEPVAEQPDAEPVGDDGDTETAPESAGQSTGSNNGVTADDTGSGSGAQVDDTADTMPPASEADQASDAETDDNASSGTPSPAASDRAVAPAVGDRGKSAEDDIEAAALAAYRGEPAAPQRGNAVFRERLTALVDQSLNRGRDRALEVSQARIIAGLLSGADDPKASARATLALDPQRQTVDVADVVKVYKQA